MEHVILGLQEYITKKRMGYDIEPISVYTLEEWLKDIVDADEKIKDLEIDLQNVQEEIEELKGLI